MKQDFNTTANLFIGKEREEHFNVKRSLITSFSVYSLNFELSKNKTKQWSRIRGGR